VAYVPTSPGAHLTRIVLTVTREVVSYSDAAKRTAVGRDEPVDDGNVASGSIQLNCSRSTLRQSGRSPNG